MKIITGILLGILAMNANASFIKQDWANAGDQLISVDTDTHLAWLSPSLLFGASWNEVQDHLNNDPLFRGYRFAQADEYVSLLGSDGLDIYGYDDVISPELAQRFISHFSLNACDPMDFMELQFGTPAFDPYAGPTGEGAYLINFSGIHREPGDYLFIADLANPFEWYPDTRALNRSYLLVREVPEPGTLFMLVAGLAGIASRKLVRSHVLKKKAR